MLSGNARLQLYDSEKPDADNDPHHDAHDESNPELHVDITGGCDAPQIELSPAQVELADLTYDCTQHVAVVVSNVGSLPLIVDDAIIDGDAELGRPHHREIPRFAPPRSRIDTRGKGNRGGQCQRIQRQRS